tara:strand:- start:5557 stop:6438 length:882 start_codon:yes stop_codon:yes gene_type:complete
MNLSNNRKDIVLAGHGFLGSYIIKNILAMKKHYNVVALSRSGGKSDCKTHKYIKYIKVDFDKKEQIFINKKSFVVYMAPPSKNNLSDERLDNFLTNINDSNVQKILYISTSGVYGNHNGMVVSEEIKPIPITDRAKRRMDAEKKIQQFSKLNKIPYVILRVPGIYGPGRLPIEKIMKKIPLIDITECPITNLINVKDLARLVMATINNNIKNEIINVSDGTPIKVTEYYLKICKAINFSALNYISLDDAKKVFDKERLSFLLESRSLDVSKMEKLLPNCIEFRNIELGIKDSL